LFEAKSQKLNELQKKLGHQLDPERAFAKIEVPAKSQVVKAPQMVKKVAAPTVSSVVTQAAV
jgi:hypothetical protein